MPFLTKEFAWATWLSMSFRCCPCASTSAAISRNTWWSSIRFFSISFTDSCRSCNSDIVSMIRPLPWSWIAFWRNVSLSPVEIKFSMVSSSAFSPVIVKYLLDKALVCHLGELVYLIWVLWLDEGLWSLWAGEKFINKKRVAYDIITQLICLTKQDLNHRFL